MNMTVSRTQNGQCLLPNVQRVSALITSQLTQTEICGNICLMVWYNQSQNMLHIWW